MIECEYLKYQDGTVFKKSYLQNKDNSGIDEYWSGKWYVLKCTGVFVVVASNNWP